MLRACVGTEWDTLIAEAKRHQKDKALVETPLHRALNCYGAQLSGFFQTQSMSVNAVVRFNDVRFEDIPKDFKPDVLDKPLYRYDVHSRTLQRFALRDFTGTVLYKKCSLWLIGKSRAGKTQCINAFARKGAGAKHQAPADQGA